MKKTVCCSTLLFSLLVRSGLALHSAGFDELPLAPGAFWNGASRAGGFLDQGVFFRNDYNPDWAIWSGFAYSRVRDTTTPGYGNQYAVSSGTDVSGDGAYAVVYDDPWTEADVIAFPAPCAVRGCFVNNTTYAALAMRDGDLFSKKFGGAGGDDPDWFKLTITGRDATGAPLGSVEFYLADYRAANPADDYIVTNWTWVDLSALGAEVQTLHFSLSSSDTGAWGMNTPAYFALDDLRFAHPRQAVRAGMEEPALPPAGYWNGSAGGGGFASGGLHFRNDYNPAFGSWSGFALSRVNDTNTPGFGNQYAVSSGTGAGGTGTWAVGFDDAWNEADVIAFPAPSLVYELWVNNTTYAALAMRDGDLFSKKFGGVSGDDPDWFKLTIAGRDAQGVEVGTVEVYLADFRSPTNSQDYILTAWQRVDLTPLGPAVKTLHFTLSSSDNGPWGMNTPAYFALDDLRYTTAWSGPEADPHAPDGGVPGYLGPDGPGRANSASNWLNPAFCGWAETVLAYAPAPDVDADWTNTQAALGPATGDHFDIVSLGDLTAEQLASNLPPGGITLRLSTPAADKTGPDLAVFENGLLQAGALFAELAFVEVSSDGTNFARFPAVSLGNRAVGAYGTQDARRIGNLAGKHANSADRCWGTPFDLGDLAADPLVAAGRLDLQNVRYLRLLDIPGSGAFQDQFTPPHPIYDSWPTYGSGGFDLEAVGVINSPEYVRVETAADPRGGVLPYGAPRGLVSVPRGSNAVFSIVPAAGYRILDVQVNGRSVGPVETWTFPAIAADQRIRASFGSALTIASPHGVCSPTAGLHVAWGPVTARVDTTPLVLDGTQLVCVGWTGTGSAPSNGFGASVSFEVREDSALVWNWATNHWLRLTAGPGGRIDQPSGWYARHAAVTCTAIPDPYFEFRGWSGDVAGDTNAPTQVVTLDGLRSLTARFGAELAPQGVPLAWLSHFGLTNDPAAEVQRDGDGDGLPAWQEWLAGSDPTDPDSQFRLRQVAALPDRLRLVWEGGTNGSRLPFGLRMATNGSGAWQTLAADLARSPDGTNVWEGAAPSAPNAFYRVFVRGAE